MKGLVIKKERSVDGWFVVCKIHNLYGQPYYSIKTWSEDLTVPMNVCGALDLEAALQIFQLSLDGQAPTDYTLQDLDIEHVPGPYCQDCDLPLWVLEYQSKQGCVARTICPNCDKTE